MVIDKKLLDELSEKARKSERLRMNFDLRDTSEDGSMRMLNALEPDTVIPIHRHTMTSEDVVVLRGKAEEIIYDDLGNVIERCIMTPGGIEPGSVSAVHVPMGQYHTCKSMESGTVIIEFKNTKYNPRTTEDILEVKE
jgi:cupin fold WbuC family metalloprotein